MPVSAQRGGGPNRVARNPGIQPQLWNMIRTYSRRLNLDPYAVAAVSRVEGGGRFGAVGDNGTSFGPFQLHVGGALPAGRGSQWANSPQGVWYAMQHMAESGAAGLRGMPAIRAIVTRFERPAAPGAEVRSAVGAYGPYGSVALPASGGFDFHGQIKAFHQQQTQLLRQQRASQRQMLVQMTQQAAQQRQANLSAQLAQQAQDRIGAARSAQRGLSAGLTQTSSPVADWTGQLKTQNDDLRRQVLSNAGIS